MNVAELVDSLNSTHAPGGPDLDRIRRHGKRLVVRRRVGTAAAIAVVAALAVTPLALTKGGDDRTSTVTPADSPGPEDAEARFESSAPMGAPVGAVVEPGMKFYLGGERMRSVGSLALWSEAGNDRTAYGARLIDKDGTLRRAGTMTVPLLDRTGVDLVRVPGQNAGEPTFVGLVPLPADAAALSGYRLRVVSEDTYVQHGFDADAVPGRLLVWVTALAGNQPGIDLSGFTLRTGAGEVIARGGFAPAS